MALCKCGCGIGAKEGNSFVKGHNGKFSFRGETHSLESRKKMRRTHIGNQSALGHLASTEARERMSLSHLGKSNGPHSEETISKIRESNLGHLPSVGAGYTKWYSYERRDSRVVKLQGTYELAIAKYLDEIDEEWECTNTSREHSFLLSTGQRYYPDFYLKRLDLYIDPKGWIQPQDEEKYERVEKEYPGYCRILLGDTYLEQLKEILSYG